MSAFLEKLTGVFNAEKAMLPNTSEIKNIAIEPFGETREFSANEIARPWQKALEPDLNAVKSSSLETLNEENKAHLEQAEFAETHEFSRHGQKALEPDLNLIKSSSLDALNEENKARLEQAKLVETRPLTDLEKNNLQEGGMTESNIEKCTIDKQNTIHLPCINEGYEGKEHPETGVPYIRKTEDVHGQKIEGVFPQFESELDLKLPEGLEQGTSAEQFGYCNDKLREAVRNDPSLREKFSEEQLEMIDQGLKPRGYTWHHNEECGKMQLVKTKIHEATRHTGGNSIWGGGI